MIRFVVGFAIACALLAGAAAGPTNVGAAASERKAAPSFSLEDAQGKNIKLSNFRGKVVLLDFWATWCHGCKTEIPWFMEFHKKYAGDGLAVIGVSMDDDGWKSVKPFVTEWKIPYPIVVGNQELGKLYSVENMLGHSAHRPQRQDRRDTCGGGAEGLVRERAEVSLKRR